MDVRLVAAAVVAVPVLAAGCGSGANAPGVASLAGAGTTTTPEVAPPAGGALSSGSGGGRQLQMKMAGGLKFAQCMRAHGVSRFPDPGAGGQLTIGSANGIDPSAPSFRAAQAACAKTLPNGGRPTPQQIEKAKRAALAFSACMRAHGLKDFPDPVFSSGGGGIRLSIGGRGSDLNPNGPAFRRAQSICGGMFGKGKP